MPPATISSISIYGRIPPSLIGTMHPRKLMNRTAAETTAEIAARVLRAREIQRERFAAENETAQGNDKRIFCNAAMNNRMIEKYCPLSDECKSLLEKIIERNGLSARACSRIIKLARTIADLAESADISPPTSLRNTFWRRQVIAFLINRTYLNEACLL